MSQENVEANIRAGIEALNRHDLDEMFDLLGPDPECEIDMSRALWAPNRGVHGIERFRSLLQEIIAMWASARWEINEYIDLGEHVVVSLTGHFLGRDGIEVQGRMAWLYTFRDEALRRVTLYQEREEALEATGLSE